MARVPAGAELIKNRMSGAPGIRLGNIFIMAGVPQITAGMLDALSGTLDGGRPMLYETVGCWVAESEVAELLGGTARKQDRKSFGLGKRVSVLVDSGGRVIIQKKIKVK